MKKVGTRGLTSIPSQPNLQELRDRAQQLIPPPPENRTDESSKDNKALVHELRVHQIELELQNQELQRAHLEAELARSKYFDLYDLAPVGYATFGLKGEIREINLAGARLLQEERRRLVGRRFQLFVTPGDIPRFNDFMEKVFSSGTRQICEMSLFKNGNSPAKVHLEGILVEPGEESGPQCQAVFLDITEQSQAQEALRNRESDLRLIMEAVPALIAHVDTQGCYRQINENYARWFSRSLEEARGRHMRDFLGEDQWGEVKDYVARALAGEKIAYERQLPYQGGASRWILATYTPQLDELNRVQGFVVHVMDIEERKKIEQAVKISEENYQRLLETANEGIVIGTSDGQIRYVNQKWADMLGYSKEEILGRFSLDFMDEDQKALVIGYPGTIAEREEGQQRIQVPPERWFRVMDPLWWLRLPGWRREPDRVLRNARRHYRSQTGRRGA
ncbi:MAG: PAS domain S-box protein [Desulfobacteraceae bacterium]|nr:MAG: PAS domain S-box protein [Desulfobacteraceae bacterium]